MQIQIKYGRRDNIRIFGVENIDEDVYERVVEVAKDIRVTVFEKRHQCVIDCPPESQDHAQ